MIKKYKTQIIITSIITLLPVIAGLIMWNRLPDTMTTHWNMQGEADGYSSKLFAIFVPTFILLAAHWICLWATSLDKRNKEQSDKVVGMVLWIIPVTSLLVNGAMYSISLGLDISIDIFIRVLLAAMFLIMGNYMPKCKHNSTIGVKVIWALYNEENWNKTHRFTGVLWFVGGILMLATIFIPLHDLTVLLTLVILIMAFLPIFYSYLYYRQQLKMGLIKKADMLPTADDKKWSKVSIAVMVVIFTLVALFLTTGNFGIKVNETSFTIDANYWSDATIDYSLIDNIEYRYVDNIGVRTFGFGDFRLMMGEFKNDEFGAYTRYTYLSCDECIVITADDKKLVINGKDEDITKQIYDELMNKIESR